MQKSCKFQNKYVVLHYKKRPHRIKTFEVFFVKSVSPHKVKPIKSYATFYNVEGQIKSVVGKSVDVIAAKPPAISTKFSKPRAFKIEAAITER